MWDRRVLIFFKAIIRDHWVVNPMHCLRTHRRIDQIICFICLMQVQNLKPVTSHTVSRLDYDHTPSDKLTCRLNIFVSTLSAQEVHFRSVFLSDRLKILVFVFVIALFVSIVRDRVIIDVFFRVLNIKFITFMKLINAIIFSFLLTASVFWDTALALFHEDSLKRLRPENVHHWVYPDQVLNEPRDSPNYETKCNRIWRILTISGRRKHGYSVDETVDLDAREYDDDKL